MIYFKITIIIIITDQISSIFPSIFFILQLIKNVILM